jgi:thiol-disulfide isomerase/thioredoxin
MRTTLALTTFALLLLLSIGCGNSDSGSADSAATSKAAETATTGASAATNAQFTVQDLNGNVRTANEWIGKQPVVINFWGTWCPPCRREIPELVKLYDEYRDRGVEIIGVALERSASPAQVQQFADQNGMDWVIVMGNQQIAETYQIQSVPTIVVYDAAGKEVKRMIGLQDASTLKRAFESII